MIEVCVNAEQKALVGLCGFAGFRVSEALSVRPIDFIIPERMIRIRGKGDRERIVPFNQRAWSAVSGAYVKSMDRTDSRLIHYQDRSARKCITSLGKKAGLSRAISSHDLRATFATEVLARTNNVRAAQELLGHANVTTTEVYTAVSQKMMRDAVEW